MNFLDNTFSRSKPCFVNRYPSSQTQRLQSNGWQRPLKDAGLPTHEGVLKGVHNLRHTLGHRLGAARVPLETRKALLDHANGDITTHDSAAELSEFIETAERIVDRGIAQTPTLSLVHRTRLKGNVGKVSEIKKGVNSY